MSRVKLTGAVAAPACPSQNRNTKARTTLVYRFSKTYTFYPCVSVSIRGPKTKLRKLTERQRKQAIWPRMDTDTHGCGLPASSRSTGRRLEQNCMVMFWRNAILAGSLAARSPGLRLALALEIERHCSADEILQGRLIDLVAFVDVDGAPDIPVEAGVE